MLIDRMPEYVQQLNTTSDPKCFFFRCFQILKMLTIKKFTPSSYDKAIVYLSYFINQFEKSRHDFFYRTIVKFIKIKNEQNQIVPWR